MSVELSRERGNPEGQPVSFYFWTQDDGRKMVRLTARTTHEGGAPRKVGLMLDVSAAEGAGLELALGKAVIAVLVWACRDEPLAGDMGVLEGSTHLSPALRAYDVSETGEYPEQVITARAITTQDSADEN